MADRMSSVEVLDKGKEDQLQDQSILVGAVPSIDPAVPSIDPIAEANLRRKIDFHLVPVVWVMFLFSNLDRSNIGNAYAGGMREDLAMTSNQYSIALLVFFIGYVIGEVPSNMLLTRLRPSLYLPALMFVWGAVAIALAASKSYADLSGVRVVLGFAEAGFAPGVIFFLSSWYRPNELARRFCIYWTGSPASGALGGILAGGIIKSLNGTAGLHGWQWLFVIEGVATCIAAVGAAFILPDFPHTTKWLTDEERALAVARLQVDNVGGGHSAEDGGHMAALKAAFTDWRTYVFIALYMLCTGALTINYFIPVLVASMGYTGSTIQYMTVPIYAVCVVCILVCCFHSDFRRERGYHLATCGLISAVCFAGIMGATSTTAQYALLCFAAAGIWCSIPLILVWVSNTITWPAEKRAIAQAATNAMGNSASIYGAFLWPSGDAPRYFAGFGTTLSFLVLMAILAVVAKALFRKFPYPELGDTTKERQIASTQHASENAAV